jgi:ABC-type nitrate/sulfonate/bicarbonate transport system ATPase subunit
MLKVNELSMHFDTDGGTAHILDQISLTVNHGEFVTLIGPSGSGKSTLFQLIGGLLTPTMGNIVLDGKTITGTRGHIGYMPQQNTLFPWRTVEDNVIMAKEVAGQSRSKALQEAREWLQRVGLAGYERSYPHSLSGGMQQRAAFVRALLSPQELLCLDEPFGALDALTRSDMQQWLLGLWEQHQRTILFITHSIEEALLLSDRIYVLSSKPAVILEEIIVPYKRPRSGLIAADARSHELRMKIHALLRPQPSEGGNSEG